MEAFIAVRPGPARDGSRRRTAFLRVGIALLVALLAGACTRFVLSQADTLAVWYVDGYVDLTASQEELIRTSVARNLAWFREEELAKYIALLEGVPYSDSVFKISCFEGVELFRNIIRSGEA